jgi:putative oxidoreductase
MKYITHITAFLLGLVFIVFGLNFFLKFLPVPTPSAGSAAAMFMGAMFTSGFLAFVKVLEILGGLFVAIPRTRHLGLLILGPIIVNIVAFNYFFFGPKALLQAPVLLVCTLAVIQIIAANRAFTRFLASREV